MSENNIREIVDEIVAEIDTLHGNSIASDYDRGQLMAYVEALSIIQSACAGYDLSEIHLDFDVDKKYLI